MNTNVTIFNHQMFGDVRFIVEGDDFHVVAKDVVEKVGNVWKAGDSLRHIPEQWKGIHSVWTPGGSQEMMVLSEQGLYFYLGRCDKPAALQYQMWIAGEVVPSIRKHGAYIVPIKLDEMLRKPESIITMLEALKETQEELAEVKPKAERYVRYNETGRNESIGTFAKLARELGIDVGIDEMFKVLRFKRILCSGQGINWNQPYARFIRAGLMTTKPIPPEKKDDWGCTPLVTPKGVDYFLPKLPEWVSEYREYAALGRSALIN